MIDLPSSTASILFGLAVSAICAIMALSALAALTNTFQFFPPPAKASWQHRLFVVLFRLFIYPLVLLSVLFFETVPAGNAIWQYGLGCLLLITGFSLAFRVTLQMGWRNAFGEKRGLKTDGWFAVSRNPVYVATWVGQIGWGLLANSPYVWILLGLWALMYLLAPIFEEPWLRRQYGQEYEDYKRQTRRFL